MFIDIDLEPIRFDYHTTNVQRKLNEAAVELALLGEVDIARQLAEALALAVPFTNVRDMNLGLQLAWKETARWPKNVNIEEDLQKVREGYAENWGGVKEGERTFDKRGLEACLAFSGGGENDDQEADVKKSMRLVKALDISLRLASQRKDAGPTTHASTTADEAAASAKDRLTDLKMSDLDTQSADILKQIVSRWNARQGQLSALAEAEFLWPYYAGGLLADALGVKREAIQSRGQQLLDAFTKRFSNAYVPSEFENKSMRELLDMAEELTLSDDNPSAVEWWTGYGVEMKPKTLWHEPATETEITDLERRIGIALPDDLKEFLRLTNGFGTTDEGQDGILDGGCPEPTLHPTSEIKWTTHSDTISWLLTTLLVIDNTGNDGVSLDDGEEGYVLKLGERDVESTWLMSPARVERFRKVYMDMYENGDTERKRRIVQAMEAVAGSKEGFESMTWCCLRYQDGPTVAYSSFRRYLEHVISQPMERYREWVEAEKQTI